MCEFNSIMQIILSLKYLAKGYARIGLFSLIFRDPLQFTETSSNFVTAQAAQTMLRPPSPVVPLIHKPFGCSQTHP